MNLNPSNEKRVVWGAMVVGLLMMTGCGVDPTGSQQQKLSTLACGGLAGTPCPSGQTCVDDPNDSCDPNHGGADCAGLCTAATCGGFAGVACPAGQTCMTDSSAGCADCAGFCQ